MDDTWEQFKKLSRPTPSTTICIMVNGPRNSSAMIKYMVKIGAGYNACSLILIFWRNKGV